MMSFRLSCVVGAASLLLMSAIPAYAGVSAEEAAKLKTILTPMGGERAGNAEGSIPAWEGGLTTVPADYKEGDRLRDQFPDDKPKFSITAENVAQYQDKLPVGVVELMKKYPTYRVDVYPTRRTAAMPQYVYDNVFANATNATITPNGDKLDGAIGGVPFPIPQTGLEAIANHLLAWRGTTVSWQAANYVVDRSGTATLSSDFIVDYQFPYYYPDAKVGETRYYDLTTYAVNPPFRTGESVLFKASINVGQVSQAWQYLTGQRRTRQAPSVGYDTPDPLSSGIQSYDEIQVFFGATDRYNWKLVGKQEMYIPYNNNKLWMGEHDKITTPNHVNPDYVRWELHRVWVVEATLAEGKRHVLTKRRFYLDEDSWIAAAGDNWDAQGNLYKFDLSYLTQAPQMPAMLGTIFSTYDLNKGAYVIMNLTWDGKAIKTYPRKPDTAYTPAALATAGVR